MGSFKVQRRSAAHQPSLPAPAQHRRRIAIAICWLVAFGAFDATDARTAPSSSDQLMSTLTDAHNLIATAATSAGHGGGPSAAGIDDGHATGETAPKVCAFKVHRLADAQFDGKVTVLMPVQALSYVRRQAFLFHKLEARFRHAGFTYVQFVVVYPAEEAATADVGDMKPPSTDDSRTQQEQVPPAPVEDRFERMGSVFNVTVLRQRPLDARSRAAGEPALFVPTAAYVFDRCGYFTYIIYAPWSSIQRPYVKAAILSTIYDNPCDRCETNPSTYPVQFPAVSTIANLTYTSHSRLGTQPPVAELGPATTERAVTPETLTSPSNSTATNVATDPTFTMPIRVIAPITHAHRELATDSSDAADPLAGHNATQYYLKFNYIVMNSNDPSYHAHLRSDTPERLTLMTRSVAAAGGNDGDDGDDGVDNASTATHRTDDQLADETSAQTATVAAVPSPALASSSAAVELHFVTDYGKRYVSMTRDAPPPPAPARQGPVRNQFHDEFVNLEEMPRPGKQRSDTGRMVVDAERTAAAPDGTAAATDVVRESNGQEERAINEHYGKIIQWIQVSL